MHRDVIAFIIITITSLTMVWTESSKTTSPHVSLLLDTGQMWKVVLSRDQFPWELLAASGGWHHQSGTRPAKVICIIPQASDMSANLTLATSCTWNLPPAPTSPRRLSMAAQYYLRTTNAHWFGLFCLAVVVYCVSFICFGVNYSKKVIFNYSHYVNILWVNTNS